MEALEPSDEVTVPFPNGRLVDGYLVMSLSVAREVRSHLTEKLLLTQEAPAFLHPPHISQDGFMSRDDFYDFFKQLYPDKTRLGRRAGNLFSLIVRAATGWYDTETVDTEVICRACKKHVREASCKNTHRHHDQQKDDMDDYLIRADSLKSRAHHLEYNGLRGFGPGAIEDLTLLVTYL